MEAYCGGKYHPYYYHYFIPISPKISDMIIFLLLFYFIQVECKQLVTRKHNLECELENYKGEISQLKRRLEEGSEDSNEKMTALERVEFSLRNQLKEWEAKYDTLNKVRFLTTKILYKKETCDLRI